MKPSEEEAVLCLKTGTEPGFETLQTSQLLELGNVQGASYYQTNVTGLCNKKGKVLVRN
jgi:hypothetical protein